MNGSSESQLCQRFHQFGVSPNLVRWKPRDPGGLPSEVDAADAVRLPVPWFRERFRKALSPRLVRERISIERAPAAGR
jgi:hypothetical protein